MRTMTPELQAPSNHKSSSESKINEHGVSSGAAASQWARFPGRSKEKEKAGVEVEEAAFEEVKVGDYRTKQVWWPTVPVRSIG